MRVLRLVLSGLLISLLAVNSVSFAKDNDLSQAEQVELKKLQNKSRIEENLLFLKRIEDEYNYAKSGFSQISQTLQDTKAKLRDIHSDGVTLKEQLYYLDKVIDISYKKLVAISNQLTKKNNNISVLEDEIKEQEILYEKQKEFIADYLKLLYVQENSYFTTNDNQIEAFKFLLADASSSSVMSEAEYFSTLNQSTASVMDEIKGTEAKLAETKEEFEKEKKMIVDLTGALESEQKQLKAQKEAKSNLLEQTQGEEKIYLDLLETAKRQQEDARKELQLLKSNLDLIKKRIDQMGANFDPSDYDNLLDKTSRELYEFYLSAANNESVSKMAWPVLPSPERGLSAYFHDEAYKAWAGIVHNAIDIPTPQNTTIRAPLDCVVYKTQDNGFGYSYAILACKNGYLLTFGHITEFLAEEGTRLDAGAPVALSGGMPGTKGAGHLTTGPHLHFEVMKDGKYEDPLDYLDLGLLPYDTLPEKYKKKLRSKVKLRRKELDLVNVNNEI